VYEARKLGETVFYRSRHSHVADWMIKSGKLPRVQQTKYDLLAKTDSINRLLGARLTVGPLQGLVPWTLGFSAMFPE
jgi:hypothetical protein